MDGGIEVILGELIELVQATAPALWAIARRQVFANTVGNAAWGGVFLLFAVALGLVARRSARLWARGEEVRRAYNYDDWNPNNTAWVTGFLAVIALVVTFVFLNEVVMYSINPDYYVIKVLLQLVR